MPATALVASVVVVGGTLKRAPDDPFLIVPAALANEAMAVRAHHALPIDR